MRRTFSLLICVTFLLALHATVAYSLEDWACGYPLICPELSDNNYGQYIGVDEPALLFYSNTPGSGNSSTYLVTIPKEPAPPPNPNATYSFELYDAFWFGMALCDDQSAPESPIHCVPDSDSNIYDNSDPSAPDYVGKQPGGAYLELQFYPPDGRQTGLNCDSVGAKQWCAAVNIFSLGEDQNGKTNNLDCGNQIGTDQNPQFESFNFAYVTLGGRTISSPDPLRKSKPADPNASILMMNPGDMVSVTIMDTPLGLSVSLDDITTQQIGSMTASVANGFAQVLYEPNSTTCHEKPKAFHPMFSTSSEHTHVSWSAHTYNIAAVAELGHWESQDMDSDDDFCFQTVLGPYGCPVVQDLDFEGTSYQSDWPGTLSNPQDLLLHPSPIEFTGPRFVQRAAPCIACISNPNLPPPPPLPVTHDYSRVAFETDLPTLEGEPGVNSSQLCHQDTGANCVNPPRDAQGAQDFYPIFSTALSASGFECVWHLGGTEIPNTTNIFSGNSGDNSAAEFGPLLRRFVLTKKADLYKDFRNILDYNPCPYTVFFRPPNSPLTPSQLQELTAAVGGLIAEDVSLLEEGVPLTGVIAITRVSISFIETFLLDQQSGTSTPPPS